VHLLWADGYSKMRAKALMRPDGGDDQVGHAGGFRSVPRHRPVIRCERSWSLRLAPAGLGGRTEAFRTAMTNRICRTFRGAGQKSA